MARTKNTAPKISADAKKAPMAAPEAMFLLFTIVNKEKAEFYVDLLHNYEINLQKRFATRNRYSAFIAEVVFIPKCLRGYAFRGAFFAARTPRIGIMTIFTSKRTALQEYDVSNARSVHRAEGFKRMNMSYHFLLLFSFPFFHLILYQTIPRFVKPLYLFFSLFLYFLLGFSSIKQ
jgi:hypothetical protein